MDHFLYRDGCLHAEDVAISQIAAEVGTPFYLYSSATLLRHFKLFDEALASMDHLICYAMKAASNQLYWRFWARRALGWMWFQVVNTPAPVLPAFLGTALSFPVWAKPERK